MNPITNKVMSEDMQLKLKTLTKREQNYFRIMWPKSGVLYITSKPGIAKSAIPRNIAEKMGFAYQDLRLAMKDETDVGLFPKLSVVDDIDCLDFVVPRWAIEANKRPTIIHFEELNRATLQVRNAALQLLLEREIGDKFKFNENVLMLASGNLGDEDGTDVEEFDNALNNRLIHVKHTMSVDEWMLGFANVNIHPTIVSYLKVYKEYLYKDPTADGPKAYATPRSWTFLSDYIVSNYGMDSRPNDWMHDLFLIGTSYIGASARNFTKYCEELITVNITDIINRFDAIEPELAKFNRDKNSELIEGLKLVDIEPLTNFQRDNISKFFKRLGADELTAYLLGILDDPATDVDKPNTKEFLMKYRDLLVTTDIRNDRNIGSVASKKVTKKK